MIQLNQPIERLPLTARCRYENSPDTGSGAGKSSAKTDDLHRPVFIDNIVHLSETRMLPVAEQRHQSARHSGALSLSLWRLVVFLACTGDVTDCVSFHRGAAAGIVYSSRNSGCGLVPVQMISRDEMAEEALLRDSVPLLQHDAGLPSVRA